MLSWELWRLISILKSGKAMLITANCQSECTTTKCNNLGAHLVKNGCWRNILFCKSWFAHDHRRRQWGSFASSKRTVQEFTKPYLMFYLSVLRSDSREMCVCALHIVLEWVKNSLVRQVLNGISHFTLVKCPLKSFQELVSVWQKSSKDLCV